MTRKRQTKGPRAPRPKGGVRAEGVGVSGGEQAENEVATEPVILEPATQAGSGTPAEAAVQVETDAEPESEAAPEIDAAPETESDAAPEAESDAAPEIDAESDTAGEAESVSSIGTLSAEDDEEIELTPRDRPGLEKAPPLPTGEGHLKGILESLLFVTDRPLPVNRIAKIARASAREVQRLLDVLVQEYRGRGLELVEVAGGYQFRSSAENAPFVRELVARKPVRLTRAQIEALSILAYRQPITRPEIDEIRGVDTGSALKVLLEKGLVRIIGRKEEPGRPLLYGTTPYFLEFFGLPSLAELPTLREYSELSDESRALFQRRTGEAIDQIGNLGVEARHYSEDEVEAEEALAGRRLHGEDETPLDEEVPDAQGELPLGEGSEPPPDAERVVPEGPPSDEEEDDDDDEDDDDEDDDEDEDDEDEE